MNEMRRPSRKYNSTSSLEICRASASAPISHEYFLLKSTLAGRPAKAKNHVGTYSRAFLSALRQYDAVRVRAAFIVQDTPTIRCFCKDLLIEHHADDFKRKSLDSLSDVKL
jgi:hypothetical protein